jgi:tetratricopeptide (TPR) repeat protein
MTDHPIAVYFPWVSARSQSRPQRSISSSTRSDRLESERGQIFTKRTAVLPRLIRALVLVTACHATAVATAHVPDNRYRAAHQPFPHPTSDGRTADSWCAAHVARGELLQALFDCDHAVAENPENVKALSNRGSLFLRTKDAVKALVDFEQALRLNPSDPTLHYNRGLAMASLGRHADAIADYSEAIRLRPDMAIAHHNRGYERELLGQLEQALQDYRRALELHPDLKPSAEGVKRLLGK